MIREQDRAGDRKHRELVLRAPPVGVPEGVNGLRVHWNRTISGLFGIISVTLGITLVCQVLLLSSLGATARSIENSNTAIAALLSDHAVYAGYVHRYVDGESDSARLSARARVESSFQTALQLVHGDAGARLIEQAHQQWLTNDASRGPVVASTPAAQRMEQHAEITMADNATMSLVERAAAAARAHLRTDLTRVVQAAWTFTAALLAASVLAGTLMLRFGRRFSAEILQPIEALRNSATQLAGGDLAHRTQVAQANELGELAIEFNRMADELSASQRNLAEAASHDHLTGLKNRGAFLADLQDALARPKHRPGGQALLFIDLDGFKEINDSLGHAVGDQVLRVVGERLRRAARGTDLVGRFGGDEFALFLDLTTDPAAALDVAERVVTTLCAPIGIAGTNVEVGASVGLAIPTDHSDPDIVIRQADTAMYIAKAQGGNRVVAYRATLDPPQSHPR